MTYKEAYDKILPEHKRKEEKYNFMCSYLTRPISIWMTLPLINTRISPTIITKISILFSTIGFVLLGFFDNVWIKFAGWIFILLWDLLDGVDGNLARCTNRCSNLGDLWDTMGGYIAMVYIYFASGIAAFFDKNTIMLGENYWFLILGGVTAIFSIFPRLVMHKKKSSLGNSESIRKLTDKKSFGLKNIIAMNFISPTGFILVFMLISIFGHFFNLFITIYALINFLVMLLSLRSLLKE